MISKQLIHQHKSSIPPPLYTKIKEMHHDYKRLLRKSNELSRILLEFKAILTCSICLELQSIPQILECGHSYCFECTKGWLEKSNQCPTCRHPILQKPIHNLPMDSQIQHFKSSLKMPIDSTKEKEDFEHYKNSKDAIWSELVSSHEYKIPFFDQEDQVSRCRNCFWELEIENAPCPHCQLDFSGFPDESDEDNASIEYPLFP